MLVVLKVGSLLLLLLEKSFHGCFSEVDLTRRFINHHESRNGKGWQRSSLTLFSKRVLPPEIFPIICPPITFPMNFISSPWLQVVLAGEVTKMRVK
jgi:hypothetical protein